MYITFIINSVEVFDRAEAHIALNRAGRSSRIVLAACRFWHSVVDALCAKMPAFFS